MATQISRLIMAAAAITAFAAPAGGQGVLRRSSAAPSDRATPASALQAIQSEPAHPFAGVWQRSAESSLPELSTVARSYTFEFANGEYTGYASAGTLVRASTQRPQLQATVVGKQLTWEVPKASGGTWVYSAELVDANTLKGVITSRDVSSGPGAPAPKGTFTLSRREASK